MFYEIVALVVFAAAISIAVTTHLPATGATTDASVAAMIQAITAAVLVADLLLLSLWLPALALSVRRLHDTNRSGWYYLISLIPMAGSIALLVIMCEDSTRGPNLYGPALKYV